MAIQANVVMLAMMGQVQFIRLKPDEAGSFGQKEGTSLPLVPVPVVASQTVGHSCVAVNRSRHVQQLQIYHISKCGGSTINEFFAKRQELHKFGGGLTELGRKAFKGEMENNCDPQYCGRKPKDVFIVGTVRNPFEYYLSYWMMICKMKRLQGSDPYEYGCQGQGARPLGFGEVYDEANIRNKTTFRRWLHYFVKLKCGKCNCEDLNMGHIYQKMMFTKDGTGVVYDALVRLEDFWNTFEQSLRLYECYVPGAIRWDIFEEKRARDLQRGHGGNYNKNRDKMPYHCYYDDASRKIVEENDAVIFKHHGYTFQEMQGRGRECPL